VSIALETGSGTKVYRYTGRMATDVTSEGGGEPAVVAASGSGIPVEPERRIGEFGLRTAGAAREIGLWYFFELGRDESLKLPDFELSELFLGVGSGIVTSEPRSREL